MGHPPFRCLDVTARVEALGEVEVEGDPFEDAAALMVA
jgi:hypothetical protein